MTLDQIETKIRANLSRLRSLKATVKFDLDKAGMLFVDAKTATPTLSQDDREADCTIRITPENLSRLIDGDLDPTVAYATGRLKVKGSMGVAIKLGSLLGE